MASISFPAIATGIPRYPPALAAKIAVGTVVTELRKHAAPMAVRFVLFTPAMLELYAGAALAHFPEGSDADRPPSHICRFVTPRQAAWAPEEAA